MKKIILLSLIILTTIKVNAQEHFELEASTGWNFYNLFNDADFFDNRYQGYGLQHNINGWYSRKVNNTFTFRGGLGYSAFQHLDFELTESSHYGSLRLGTDIQTFWKPMKLTTNLSTYVSLHRETQDDSKFQNRYFTNLDVGLRFNLGKRFALTLNSPINLIPMFEDNDRTTVQTGIGGGSFVLDADVELTGLHIGLVYQFNQSKTIIPKMRFSDVEDNLSIEVSSGFLLYDLFNRPEDEQNFFQSPAIQTSVDLWFSKQVNEKFDACIGLGYSNFYHINSEVFFTDTSQSTHYLNFRLGTDIKTRWEKVDLSFAFSNYISLEKYPQDIFEFQQRFFTNLDLGAKIKLSDKLNLRVTTPITLSPMLKGINWAYGDNINELTRVPSTSVGMSGINLGLIYNFK